ncbi:MAG: hypothetical protein HYV97_01065 [Bdellovibrio sp.]|nr:hypothetical protein [Bdellovibrio sp.]
MKHDILSLGEESLNIEVIAGKIHSCRSKNITKKGLRIFDQNKIYSYSYVGEISDEQFLRTSTSKMAVGTPCDFSLPPKTEMQISDDESMQEPLSAILKVFESSKQKLARFEDRFTFSGKFRRQYRRRSLQNDQGMQLKSVYGMNEWNYFFKEKGSAQIIDGYFGETARTVDVEDVLDKNLPFIEAYSRILKIKSGSYPVLFISDDILLSKIMESFIADKYCTGAALYSGKLNAPIVSSAFSLYDINHSPEHGIYRKFDDEGTVRRLPNLPLIERGVMKNIIADLRSAKKYGIEATGNGRRNFDSAVTTNFNSLVVGAGKRSTQDILKSLEDCIVVFMGWGGEFTDQGDFSTPLQLSYLLKKGAIAGRLPQLTVKTTTQDMFGSRLIEIASDAFQKTTHSPSIFSEMNVYLN